jgi:hypothetical protein
MSLKLKLLNELPVTTLLVDKKKELLVDTKKSVISLEDETINFTGVIEDKLVIRAY